MSDMNMPEVEDEGVRKVGVIMLGLFGVLSILACCGGGGYTGFAASGSESAGMTAAYISAFPVFFSISGLFGALIGHFAVKKSKPLKIALPLILGFLCGGCGFGMVLVFFEAIFPAL